jgi:hypothetical protein
MDIVSPGLLVFLLVAGLVCIVEVNALFHFGDGLADLLKGLATVTALVMSSYYPDTARDGTRCSHRPIPPNELAIVNSVYTHNLGAGNYGSAASARKRFGFGSGNQLECGVSYRVAHGIRRSTRVRSLKGGRRRPARNVLMSNPNSWI